MTSHFIPTRIAGLKRLAAFVPKAGRAYAARRNYDRGPGRHADVSMLSPYLRHRLITEEEAVLAVLAQHSESAAEKFIQEICWRTYWKGWLEQNPRVWTAYVAALDHARRYLGDDHAMAAEVAAAERGDTGIACFDCWVKELVETGYLHNHARMWFASIWIFTLKLPWVLGADFFYRHLIDGDPASNTLSWRWVAGLHTKGKTYLARPDNIATYTEGRFQPGVMDLAAFATPLDDDADDGGRQPLRQPGAASSRRSILLITDEDLHPESLNFGTSKIVAVAAFDSTEDRRAPLVRAFKVGALRDATSRAAAHWSCPSAMVQTSVDLQTLAVRRDADCVVTAFLPVGPTRDEVSELCCTASFGLLELQRRWDASFWPYAKAGFFGLKAKIPTVLKRVGVTT
jgi:deoxyribodipyrimidine photo-lyase